MEFLGLIFTFVAIGSVFFLWSQAIRSKARIPDYNGDEAVAEQSMDKQPEFLANFMLLPEAPRASSASAKEQGLEIKDEPAHIPAPGDNRATVSIPSPIDAAAHTLSNTQLEIANQFFQTGDFEGAVEMSEIVLSSETATPEQKERARTIIEHSA